MICMHIGFIQKEHVCSLLSTHRLDECKEEYGSRSRLAPAFFYFSLHIFCCQLYPQHLGTFICYFLCSTCIRLFSICIHILNALFIKMTCNFNYLHNHGKTMHKHTHTHAHGPTPTAPKTYSTSTHIHSQLPSDERTKRNVKSSTFWRIQTNQPTKSPHRRSPSVWLCWRDSSLNIFAYEGNLFVALRTCTASRRTMASQFIIVRARSERSKTIKVHHHFSQ